MINTILISRLAQTLLIFLYSIAEFERLFSKVKLIKTDNRSTVLYIILRDFVLFEQFVNGSVKLCEMNFLMLLYRRMHVLDL